MTTLGSSLVLRFDGSVRYGPHNANPRGAAIGYVVEERQPLAEGSRELSAFVSSTHVELRALVAGAQTVAALTDHLRVSDVHVRGDAAAVIDTVAPCGESTVDDRISQRRAERVRNALAPVPRVTYRCVSRHENERAHEKESHTWRGIRALARTGDCTLSTGER
ncbi:reverse transcriptase-like protein [Halorientalis litorea]|uniref:reverse transcriptase-like protein n=1 Tax=Halorientalis litorea TaxID=2931977 RepID=UPI001FF39DA8|nr:reverse transcriptase-like protein [Halorientalis litorea]